MLDFKTNIPEYRSDLNDIVRMYVPFFRADIDVELISDEDKITVDIDGKVLTFYKKGADWDFFYERGDKAELKFAKVCLYDAFKEYFGRELPWGALTGIRPTKLMYKLMAEAEGRTIAEAAAVLREVYRVRADKTELAARIIETQRLCSAQDGVNLYVHIPFCPTRCGYCSFVSLPADKHKKLIEPYLDKLTEEIIFTKKLIAERGERILSAYIGGGTPTVLSEEQLGRLLSAIDLRGAEFTLEAGRPDTITDEKMRIAVEGGVTRVSVNPQTLNDRTLSEIGRRHTAAEFFTAYEAAARRGLDINVDLIAGLPSETEEDFRYSFTKTAELMPQNITVHSLSIKNGSEYSEQSRDYNACAEAMVDFAESEAAARGYLPYYLYRQKNMSANLENVGFCLPGKQCVNNVTVMEETTSVYACGAGAIGKRVERGVITRLANLRDVRLYIENSRERLIKKSKFYSN